MTDTLEKTRIEILDFLDAKMVILGPIDFLFGLPINLNVNAGQNKFEVDILKNLHYEDGSPSSPDSTSLD